RHRPNLAQPDLSYHPCEAGTNGSTRRRPAKLVVDHLYLPPAKCTEPIAHRVLQKPASLIVHHLMGRRLPNIQDRFPAEMMRFDLVTHLSALPPRWREPDRAFARVADGSSGAEHFRAFPPGAATSSDSDWLNETDRAVGHGRDPDGASASPFCDKE